MSGGGGTHGWKAREQYSHDAVERVRERDKLIREKDEEIARLKRHLDTAAKDLRKVSDHSKHQSQEMLKLKVKLQYLAEGCRALMIEHYHVHGCVLPSLIPRLPLPLYVLKATCNESL